ncbi:HK97-gp10 family putative phage morphogenesis protein [Halobacillus salinus]|uniref:HK97-gp10 family putative phage morphogenesis protein n=1 Tax=Halobacillus salinus TaxID=192814 RepID=UPI0009A62DBB|nr:HK97-gp10 family putative phage morphogenesis protein [Halobacillus salinus]
MELNGLDALFEKLDQMENEIEDDLNTIVKNNTIEMTSETMENERERFIKGYWTGHTLRNTKTQKLGDLSYQTLVDSEYAGYLEFGTRYMDPTWFLRDAFFKQRDKFKSDLDRLIK